MSGPPPCGVCGEPCLTDVGGFRLPIQNPLTGQAIIGPCCAVCGPKVEAYVESGCQDFDLLPAGPLADYLRRIHQVYTAKACMDAVGWLADNCAQVHYRNSGMVAGEPADEVEVTVGGRSVVAPTLQTAIDALVGK